jgi:indolepyruvate ferredoxin oxidoreductase alpha subunit
VGLRSERLLLGNEAIGRALVECGVTLAASYPGTPASEILAAVVAAAKETGAELHAEWSINEKVAFETALANAMCGRRAAVAMKQVGLNVAADPFFRAAYLGVTGGFLVVAADDPGPHSSQTEQDSRLVALAAQVPVLDPMDPREAGEMVGRGLELSERHEVPVMLRPTTRVCHARQNVPLGEVVPLDRPARFVKDPGRWAATPALVRELHRRLKDKLAAIAREAEFAPDFLPGDGRRPEKCIVASGVAAAHALDVLAELNARGQVDFYRVKMPFPLHQPWEERIRQHYQEILVLEEPGPVIELQLGAGRVTGRAAGAVPGYGELTPEILRPVLAGFLGLAVPEGSAPAAGGVRPSLCAGCGHRGVFYALRETFPHGIFPSDIGCYTLGVNLQAVDTCHCMGAGISQAAGFYHAYAAGGDFPPIVATIGDSTFYHAGIPALINAVFHRARFLLVILDNQTTAMTGHQPTPAVGVTAQGRPATPVALPELIQACGVKFLREVEAYDLPELTRILSEADQFCRRPEGGVAVIIARHPCLLTPEGQRQLRYRVRVTEACVGCRHCLEAFECRGLRWEESEGRAAIDPVVCVGCGVCVHVCPAGAIEAEAGG